MTRAASRTTAEERAEPWLIYEQGYEAAEAFVDCLIADVDALTTRERALVEALTEEHLSWVKKVATACEASDYRSRHVDDIRNGRWRNDCVTCVVISGKAPPLSGTEEARRQSRPDDVT